jgi:hypothetical protein
VGVDRLSGDEQPHYLARSFEDAVNPQVPQRLLGRYRTFAARG